MQERSFDGRFKESDNKIIIGEIYGCLKVENFSHKAYNNVKCYNCSCQNRTIIRKAKTFKTINEAILCRFSLEDFYFGEFTPQRDLYKEYGYNKEIQNMYLKLLNII